MGRPLIMLTTCNVPNTAIAIMAIHPNHGMAQGYQEGHPKAATAEARPT